MSDPKSHEVATLAGGCFWCTEAVFQMVRGVETVVSGYTNGQTKNPTYRDVCSGTTGHAEAVEVTFDPSQISYREILEVFMVTHDPTSLNRQGADAGTQYRSAIFTHSPEQMATAKEVIADLNQQGIFPNKIVTEVTLAAEFYPAEEYHQNYYNSHPGEGYCQAVIAPKVGKFRSRLMEKYGRPGG